MKSILISCLLIFYLGCASFNAISSSELESRHLIGQWTSSSDSRLNIYCSGALSYEMNGYSSLLGPTKSTCSGCVVNEIQGNQLLLGPVVTTKINVTRWPYKDGVDTKMVAEGFIWTRESTKACP